MAICTIFLCLSMVLLQMMTIPSIAIGNIPRFLDKGSVDGDPRSGKDQGKTWAVLVAGSNGFENYRHQATEPKPTFATHANPNYWLGLAIWDLGPSGTQITLVKADVCHAYQLLKKGGLEDENIIVFMYDDIANNKLNPRPGVIINKPDGEDVYKGVPKDYTGEQASPENLYAVIHGNKTALKGGSGKVVNSASRDRIFIFYSDHGGAGVLAMANDDYIYADDFIKVLKEKHASGTYKEMVIYVEACESGSIFEGLLPQNLSIYVTTASDAHEDSFGTYCPGTDPSPPEDFPCLGDLYSVSWMEDSDSHNRKKETIEQQYEKVKERTSNNHTYGPGSHVMEYGNTSMHLEKLYLYQGFNPASENFPPNDTGFPIRIDGVDQRSADLYFLRYRYKRMKDGSAEKAELLKQITNTENYRKHLDESIESIGASLFGRERSPSVLTHIRAPGQPVVDDWQCLKSMVRIFETHCGTLTQYGMKHMRAFANICNSRVIRSAMEEACKSACSGPPTTSF